MTNEIHNFQQSQHVVARDNNKILRTHPQQVSSTEEHLRRHTRRTLAQLKTNKSPFLLLYLHKIELFEDNLPLVKVKVTYSNKLPWITQGLRESVKTKRLLHKKMEQNPSSENKSIYKKFRNLLTSLMRRTQRDYLEEQLEIANSAKKVENHERLN